MKEVKDQTSVTVFGGNEKTKREEVREREAKRRNAVLDKIARATKNFKKDDSEEE